MKNKKQENVTIVEVQPTRKLSPWRVLLGILILAGLGVGSVLGWKSWKVSQSIASQKPWFGAYVDVTSTPTYSFEELSKNTSPNVVLSFIVSSHEDPCIPTWGGYFTAEEASINLDLDRRIARFQQKDGKVAISFGGALNDELSFNCRNEKLLSDAYESIIERYRIDTIDLDLENHSLSNTEAAVRRAKVIGKLQEKRRSQGKPLAIWLTLPVTPMGLTADGTNAVSQMLNNGVDLAGVNVMTMNYGESIADSKSMGEASERALIETQRQLGILYDQAGISLNGPSLWRKIGATPMLGQNDIAQEIFDLDDAKRLNKFSTDKGIGRMSMWSANRDVSCSDNYADLKVVSDSCSGIVADQYAFMGFLSEGYYGDLAQNSTIVTTDDPDANTVVLDDPETSPYQIWNEEGTYLKGVKVVWRGNVYEAKWWTRADAPDNPILQSWESPWQLIGPVLPGEKPLPQLTLPEGTYPEWIVTRVYQVGDRVLYEGVPYEAKQWVQSISPETAAINPQISPWQPLSSEDIEAILEEQSS